MIKYPCNTPRLFEGEAVLSNLRYRKVIAIAAVALGPLVGLTACGHKPQAPKADPEIGFSCPAGQVNLPWLAFDLMQEPGFSHDLGNTIGPGSIGGQQIDERCIGRDEITKMVADKLPALHAAVDEQNASIDKAAQAIAQAVQSLNAITDPKQRLIEVLKDSCKEPAGTFSQYGYEYWATPFVDASPATIDALIARYHKGEGNANWPPRAPGPLDTMQTSQGPMPYRWPGPVIVDQAGPVYGHFGTIKSMDQELKDIYDAAWGPAYDGQIIDPPRSYQDAVQYSCNR